MREFVGIKSPIDLILEVLSGRCAVQNVFKREALMFDRIGCLPKIEEFSSILQMIGSLLPAGTPNVDTPRELGDHLSYLNERGLILDLPPSADEFGRTLLEANAEFQNITSIEQTIEPTLISALGEAGLGPILNGKTIAPAEMETFASKVGPVIPALFLALQVLIRRKSIELTVLNRIDAYPILSEFIPYLPFAASQKCKVIDLAISQLPIVADSAPWEHIFEYRADPDSQTKFRAFRHWMSDVARASLTPAEVEEKLEYLINEYQKHLRFHRMKANVGTFETVFVALADAATLDFGKAARGLFSIKHRQVSLLEGELTSPGKEVAYIVKARETFTSST